MGQYGIKEHNVEKQVFGNTPQSYQYPMQENTFNNNPSQTNTFNNQGTLNGNLDGINNQGTDAFRNTFNGQFNFDAVNNLDTLNSMLKYSPSGIDTINPVFTADHEVQSALSPLNDVAFNLLEANLNNYRGTHEYHTSDHNNKNVENYKSFPNGEMTGLMGVSKAPKADNKPPSFLQDEFFKEKSTKNTNKEEESGDGEENDENESNDYKRNKGRKGKCYLNINFKTILILS